LLHPVEKQVLHCFKLFFEARLAHKIIEAIGIVFEVIEFLGSAVSEYFDSLPTYSMVKTRREFSDLNEMRVVPDDRCPI